MWYYTHRLYGKWLVFIIKVVTTSPCWCYTLWTDSHKHCSCRKPGQWRMGGCCQWRLAVETNWDPCATSQWCRTPGTKAVSWHRSLSPLFGCSDEGESKWFKLFHHFHIEPYQLLSKSPLDQQSPEIRIHGELYTSQSFLMAHADLQKSDREPGCQLTWVICAFMFWSDETHLTSFRNGKLWPVYIYFGNKSKYHHGKPSNNSSNQVAYLEKVR